MSMASAEQIAVTGGGADAEVIPSQERLAREAAARAEGFFTRVRDRIVHLVTHITTDAVKALDAVEAFAAHLERQTVEELAAAWNHLREVSAEVLVEINRRVLAGEADLVAARVAVIAEVGHILGGAEAGVLTLEDLVKRVAVEDAVALKNKVAKVLEALEARIASEPKD